MVTAVVASAAGFAASATYRRDCVETVHKEVVQFCMGLYANLSLYYSTGFAAAVFTGVALLHRTFNNTTYFLIGPGLKENFMIAIKAMSSDCFSIDW
jgi:hypothetical protein